MNVHSLARTTRLSRALLVQRVRVHGWSVSTAARAAGVSQRSAYKWLRRYRQYGLDGLVDGSSRPRISPNRLCADRVELIVRLRRCRKTSPQIAAELRMARSTVSRVLLRSGLQKLKKLEAQQPVHRYERRRPGELIHLDVKKLGRIAGGPGHRIHGDHSRRARGVGWEFVHVCIDDASRLAYVEVLNDEQTITAVGFLHRAVSWYARLGIRVRRVMTDNGSCYVSGLFRGACQRLKARHIRTRPYRPCTNGKAERFIQTLMREWAYARPYHHSRFRTAALPRWLSYYNRKRPHGSLSGRPPFSRLSKNAEQRP